KWQISRVAFHSVCSTTSKEGRQPSNLTEICAILLSKLSSVSGNASDSFTSFALGMKVSKMTHAVGLHRWSTWSS
ncbi:hypothetical protein ANCDUO_25946, partial [Ancylostoma duodenale]